MNKELGENIMTSAVPQTGRSAANPGNIVDALNEIEASAIARKPETANGVINAFARPNLFGNSARIPPMTNSQTRVGIMKKANRSGEV